MKIVMMALLLLTGFTFASSAKADTPTWTKSWQSYLSNPLDTFEQPYPTYNPTSCAWNDQDRVEDYGRGDLYAETTDTQCVIADLDDRTHGNYPKNFAAQVGGAKPDFTAWITSDPVFNSVTGQTTPGARWDLPAPTWNAADRAYVSQTCIADPVGDAANSPSPLSSYWPQVPGSAGYGLQVDYTLHVAPSTAQTVHKFWALYEVHGSAATPYDPGYSPRYLTDVPCPPNDGL